MMPGRLSVPPRLSMLLAFGIYSAVNYSFSLAIGWLVAPGDFGLFAFSQTVMLIAGLVLQLGLPRSLTAAIIGVAQHEREVLIRGTLIMNLLLAMAMSLFIVILFALGSLRPGLETSGITAAIAFALPFIGLINVVNGALQGVERFGAVALMQVLEVSCKALVGIVLVVFGLGVQGAILGILAGAIVTALLGVYHLLRTLGIRPRGAVRLPTLSTTGPMFGAMLGLVLLLNLDLISLKLFTHGERLLSGYYQAGIILANAPYYLVTSVIIPILFTQLARVSTIVATRNLVSEALGMAVITAIAVEILLLLAPDSILSVLFPPAYAPGAIPLRLLAVGNSMLIVVAILSAAFQAIGRAAVPATILLGITGVEPFILWWVVPRWGALGAASVFSGAVALALLALAGTYLWSLDRVYISQIASWLARYITAIVASAVVGMLVSSISGFVLAVGMAGFCYLAMIFALRLSCNLRTFVQQSVLMHTPKAAGG